MAHVELSERNPYYISKHRYYELKHFCLQYPEWEEAGHPEWMEVEAGRTADRHDERKPRLESDGAGRHCAGLLCEAY